MEFVVVSGLSLAVVLLREGVARVGPSAGWASGAESRGVGGNDVVARADVQGCGNENVAVKSKEETELQLEIDALRKELDATRDESAFVAHALAQRKLTRLEQRVKALRLANSNALQQPEQHLPMRDANSGSAGAASDFPVNVQLASTRGAWWSNSAAIVPRWRILDVIVRGAIYFVMFWMYRSRSVLDFDCRFIWPLDLLPYFFRRPAAAFSTISDACAFLGSTSSAGASPDDAALLCSTRLCGVSGFIWFALCSAFLSAVISAVLPPHAAQCRRRG